MSTVALAQSPCPNPGNPGFRRHTIALTWFALSRRCTAPAAWSAYDNGGPLTATEFHEVHFQASSINSFGPINAEIGVQLSQVPLASPVSGFIFANGVMQEATSFGPVLADRAETLGKRRIFVGASYEYFDFDKADSVNLKSFGAVFQHELEPTICATFPSRLASAASPSIPETSLPRRTASTSRCTRSRWSAPMACPTSWTYRLLFPSSTSVWA